MDKTLELFGIARKAGCLAIGEESAGAAVRAGKAKLLLLAGDASENARRRAEGFVYATKVPLNRLPHTKEELSLSVGKQGCSMLAVTDVGLAAELTRRLALTRPDEFGETARALAERDAKAAELRREAKAHERNRKQGKRRKQG